MTSFSTRVISIDELWHFFNFSSSLYCIAETSGYLRHINPSFSLLLGFTEEEFLQKPFIKYIHPCDRKMTLKKLKVLKANKTMTISNRCITKEGSYKWLSWSLTYSERFELIYANAQDHTERFLKEKRLQKQRIVKQKKLIDGLIRSQNMKNAAIGKELLENTSQLLNIVAHYMDITLDNNGDVKDKLKEARLIQQEAIDKINSLSKAMMTPNEEEIGFIESIRELINTMVKVNTF